MRSVALSLLAFLLLAAALPAAGQQAHSRVSPLIVNPGSEAVGSVLRLADERVDAATITRKDRTIRQGSDLRTGQDQAVTRIQAARETPVDDTGRVLARATAEQDRERHRRVAAVSD